MSCTGLVMKARRERLGISATTLSRILEVREDNIRKWEIPGSIIPDFVDEELLDIEELTRDVVSDVVSSWHRNHEPVTLWARLDEVPISSIDEIFEFGVKWWRTVIAEALQDCPDMTVIETSSRPVTPGKDAE